MRLIDADEFKEDLMKLWDYSCVDGITATTVLKQVMHDIDNAPTVKAYTDEELKKKYDEGRNDGYATCYDRYVRKNDEPFC